MRLPFIGLLVTLLASVNASLVQKRAAVDDCLVAAGVPTDIPGSTDWKYDVAPFNQRFNYTPVAIVVPTNVQHIQSAVSCAAKVGVKVNPKSGGHSYAAFGLGGEDGHLVVELDRMNEVKLDPETNMSTIQPGARLGHVATSLYDQGKRAFSHGTCPGVGLGGHALHGGYGFSSHTHGLALDWIQSATVVLANATVVNCSTQENADLFWALRGAGSSFGIVTSLQFNTFEPPPVMTVFTAELPWGNAEQAMASWTVLQNWTQNSMPSEMNMRVFGSSVGAQLQGLYHGELSALKTAIEPLMTLLNTSLTEVDETDWMGGFTSYAYTDDVDLSHPYNAQETFFSKSLLTSALPEEAMQAAVDYWLDNAHSTSRIWYVIIDMYGGKNAAIPKVPGEETSYAHRDKLYLYEFYDRQFFGTFPANGFDFLNGWVDAFTTNLDTTQWGMYINYADPTMDRTEAQENYWRQNLPRLQRIKADVDPTDIFYYPQSIKGSNLA